LGLRARDAAIHVPSPRVMHWRLRGVRLSQKQTREIVRDTFGDLAGRVRFDWKHPPNPGLRIDCDFTYDDETRFYGTIAIYFGYLASINYEFEAFWLNGTWVLEKFEFVGGA